MFDFTLATTPEICVELGRRLRARRLVQGWSQIELSQRAGISAGTIKNLEKHGRATLESVIHVVAALGLSDELRDIFLIRMVSIAAMEKAERANRQRAPRKASR